MRPHPADTTFLALVGVDLVSKVAAWQLLPRNGEPDFDAPLSFVVQLNETGLGSWARTIADGQEVAMVQGTFGYLGLAVALVLLRGSSRPRLQRAAFCIAAFVVPIVVAHFFTEPLATVDVLTLEILKRMLAFSLFFVLWRIIRNRFYWPAITVFAASSCGNLIGYFYPPHRTVDFMYSPWLNSTFSYGVFNFADLYYLAALALFPLGLGAHLVATVRGAVATARAGA